MSTSYPPPPGPDQPYGESARPPLPTAGPIGPPPPTVVAAVGLMFTEIVLSVIGAVIAVATLSSTKDAIRKSLEKSNSNSSSNVVDTTANFGLAVGIAITLILLIGFAVLAVLLRRGSQVARIVTWVLSGVMLCCTAFSAIGVGAGANGMADQPGWHVAWTWFSVIAQLLIFIGIVVLLALPASNTYYRRAPTV